MQGIVTDGGEETAQRHHPVQGRVFRQKTGCHQRHRACEDPTVADFGQSQDQFGTNDTAHLDEQQRKAQQPGRNAPLWQFGLQKEHQQRIHRAHKGVAEHQAQRWLDLPQKAEAFTEAAQKPHPKGLAMLPFPRDDFLQRGQHHKLNGPGDQADPIGQLMPDGQRETSAQGGQAVAAAPDDHLVGFIPFKTALLPCQLEGIIGQRVAGAGSKVIAQRPETNGQAHHPQVVGQDHHHIGYHGHEGGDDEHLLFTEHIRQHAGGNFEQQADDMEHRLRNADFHKAVATGCQNGHPRAGEGQIADNRGRIEFSNLLFVWKHKKISLPDDLGILVKEIVGFLLVGMAQKARVIKVSPADADDRSPSKRVHYPRSRRK